MAQIRYTRNLFLRGMSVVYLFAFTSFYLQIPGLYGNNGVLPARTQFDSRAETLSGRIHNKPTLLWLAPYIGLDVVSMMEILSLFGILLSFTGFISQKFCSAVMFAGLWSLYYSLYQVGQTFMWFQWDLLLLEAGFLCLLVAPLRYGAQNRRKQATAAPSVAVSFWLVRWLLFRLMFASGIVKLTSGCPTWWGLTALSVHFESQCIPTPLAWYSHHLPMWFLQLSTVLANVIEIGVPLLFFLPVRSVRIVAYFLQVFLQVAIIATGNYNFFNLLTLTLCLSLLDDDYFNARSKPVRGGKKEKAAAVKAAPSRLGTVIKALATLAVYGGVIYATCILFGLKISSSGTIDSKIMFTRAEFDTALSYAVPATAYMGLASLGWTVVHALISSVSDNHGSKVLTVISTVFYSVAALALFTVSLVPHSTLHASGNATVLPAVRAVHHKLDHLHVANAYGLFRSMTGVGGRPEVVIEGANHLDGPWREIHFRYKPGNVNFTLPFVAPHQPRLDWQMWFASLGTYHQNPWLMSLAYRILSGQREVLDLLDTANNPFPGKPPKYVRAHLYLYHYTPWNHGSSSAWWTREKKAEYFPIFSRDHAPLLDYLRNLRILPDDPASKAGGAQWLRLVLDQLRYAVTRIEAHVLCWSLLTAGCAIVFTTKK